MKTIVNPILPGFHPDPSIIRVGQDYYIAVSTFEWFPGVCIYHSRDLQNWELISRPLQKISQLDMKGNDASGGVFAPCLSYDQGTYYLVYSNVRTHWYDFMDCHNYLVTAKDIQGPWSEPVYLHSAGFDSSMFHDTDGRKYIVGLMRHFRKDRTQKIILQEYDESKQRLTGEMKEIYAGSGISIPEGPHLYKRGEYYYLLTAEGGTEYGHAVTMARSKKIDGPYECHPGNPVLTSRDNLKADLQKAGHADLVDTPDGQWYMTHLCARPLPPFRRCTLGRETAIQKVVWKEDGWLYLEAGGREPKLEVPGIMETQKKENETVIYEFHDRISEDFHSLRIPAEEFATIQECPGYLMLRGLDSPNSRFEQSFLARRQEDFCFRMETKMEFSPVSERQMAGLMYFYDEEDFYYLYVSRNPEGTKFIHVMQMDQGRLNFSLCEEIVLEENKPVFLRLEVQDTCGKFLYSVDGKDWKDAGKEWEADKISDEYPLEGAYTGAMAGVACHDMLYRNAKAYFEYVIYQKR